MALLIDAIVKSKMHTEIRSGDGKMYIERPTRHGKKWRQMGFISKIKGCWRVLTDKGLVIYYKEDE